MNRKEREEHPEESFDGGYHLYAEQKHRDRVAKNPERIAYAIEQFKEHGISYSLKNETTGHFHCWRKSDNKLFQFYAGTGKIQKCEQRGIQNLIKILEGKSEIPDKFEELLKTIHRYRHTPDLHSARVMFVSGTVAYIDFGEDDCYHVDVYETVDGIDRHNHFEFRTSNEVLCHFSREVFKGYEM